MYIIVALINMQTMIAYLLASLKKVDKSNSLAYLVLRCTDS